jgi:hypothetical protein
MPGRETRVKGRTSITCRVCTALLLSWLGAGCGQDQRKPPAEEGVPIEQAGTYLHIVVPSVIRKDEPIPVRLRPLTHVGLPDYDFEGGFRIDAQLASTKFPDDPALEPHQEGYYEMSGLSFGETGVQRIRGSVPQDTIQALANPFVVMENPEYRIYWGDLHGYSDLSMGDRAPAIFYWYARNVSLLDFAALTDSETDGEKKLDEKAYLEINAMIEESNLDGRFVALHGFEWVDEEDGGRIVLFPAAPASLPTHDAGIDSPEKLRRAVPSGSVLIVPHPSGSEEFPPARPSGIGPGAEELVEMYSALGIFEAGGSSRASNKETQGFFVVDLLAHGWKPGFVAASNTMLTMPGNPRGPAGGDAKWPVGLTAVLAKELTRASILDALRNRRCYATTGPRYLLEFTVDGQMMGSELRVKKGHRAKVYGSVGSTTNWTKVDIVAPEGSIATLTPQGANRDVVELTCETAPVNADTWVFLRGIDERGGLAWSSPVFLRPD